jgi:hypothetical protein
LAGLSLGLSPKLCTEIVGQANNISWSMWVRGQPENSVEYLSRMIG